MGSRPLRGGGLREAYWHIERVIASFLIRYGTQSIEYGPILVTEVQYLSTGVLLRKLGPSGWTTCRRDDPLQHQELIWRYIFDY